MYYEYSKYRGISIHAPARGATIASSPLSSGLIRFQSTLPRGERLFPTFFDTSVRIISIHAPARGATYKMACSVSLNVFQSTLPRGERPDYATTITVDQDFNPRSREGSDRYFTNKDGQTEISIHAPARGATQFPSAGIFPHIFQSTLPRGERPNAELFCAQWTDFNPRSREGSD